MKTKNILLALSICTATITLSSITGCKKYPDGPEFTIKTRTERLANTWKVDNYSINGTDYTSLVSSYNETFTNKGAYSYSWSFFNGSGTWDFQNKDKEVKLTGSDKQSSRTLFILKLEEKSLWYYYMDGNDRYELHLNQK
ncbi:MAG: hypothetical protein H7331_04905 [Bacteroidia bacterium]|nr:hypothetical protein [Bacteroidia bacterium]